MKTWFFFYRIKISIGYSLIWSLSNNDDNDDVNENGKKAKGLDQQNNNSARAPRFFVHFFAVTARLKDVKRPNFTFCGGREHKTTTSFFFSWTSIQSFKI